MQQRFPTTIDLNVQLGPLNAAEAITVRALLELEPRGNDSAGACYGLRVMPPRETLRVERTLEGLGFFKGNIMRLFIHRTLVEHLYSPGEED